MERLDKQQLQALVRIEGNDPSWFGKFDLFVEGFGTSVEVSIALGVVRDASDLSDRTVQTVNEIASLTKDHYKHILQLLFDDAMVFKEECCSNEPPPPPPRNWLRRLISGPQLVEVAADDPRHPLFGIASPDDIPSRVEWEGFFIDDAQETQDRIAFLTCYPPWDVEHGREVAIRNGVPVAVDQIQLNPYFYSD